MAKKLPVEEPYDAIAEEARPGESMDDYMERRDAEDEEWRGKQGGKGAKKHDANESRHPKIEEDESWDCHMGCL